MLTRKISISLRLTMWFGSIFLLGSLLFGTAMWFNLKRTLTGERRQTLARRLDRMQDLLNSNTNESEAARAQDFQDFARATGNGLDEVFRADGLRLYRSPSRAAAGFPWPDVHGLQKEAFAHVDSAGQPYWMMVRPFASRFGPVVLLAAAPEGGNLLVLNSFWHGLLESVPLVLLLASAGGYWISRSALRPVDRIIVAARSISIRNLSERVPVTDSGDELQRLSETYNDMLERLESAVKRLKQFTADASHELRAPLSLTRTVAEIALRNKNLDEQARDAFSEVVDESGKAAVLLDQMLVLARADSEPYGIEMCPVDLTVLVRETSLTATRYAEEKGLQVTLSYPEECPLDVLGSQSNLKRLIWILLDNALKYTSPPGKVGIALYAEAGRATLTVSDTGIGIDTAHLPYIFDRFYRADPSRSHVEGSGLGLSIARWIADLHRAEISVESKPMLGTQFKVSFPLVMARLDSQSLRVGARHE